MPTRVNLIVRQDEQVLEAVDDISAAVQQYTLSNNQEIKVHRISTWICKLV